MNMAKRIAVSALVLAIVASGCKQTSNPANASAAYVKGPIVLTDTENHWAKNSILSAIEKGYVDGYDDTTFRPDKNITRAEFMKILVVATGTKLGKKGINWYDTYVNALADLGVYHSEDFSSDTASESLTRAEMAKLADRVVDKNSRPKEAQLYDMTAMEKAVNLGIIQGLSDGELGLYEKTTRAQSVTIIDRVLTILSGGKPPVDKYAIGNVQLMTKKTNLFTIAPEIFGGQQTIKWDPSNLFIQSSDGNYKGVIDELVVIDLADPNDPNRNLLQDFDNLHWAADRGPGMDPYIKDYPDSYVLYFRTHNEVNNDPVKYVSKNPSLSLYGFVSPDQSVTSNGTLNTLEFVYRNYPADMTAYIIPKNGLNSANGQFQIKLTVPTRESHPENKVLFGVMLNK